VGRSPKSVLIARLERIRDLSNDLARDLARHDGNNTAFHLAMIEAIQGEADALHVRTPPSRSAPRTRKTG
jgi:hypothetical protein